MRTVYNRWRLRRPVVYRLTPCTECICGLAAAVTDLLQSVELQYNGYEGDVKNGAEGDSKTTKGASADTVKGHLNELFSLVQGLGGTSVVRTYIDQLAQVLSALVGWSRIEKCNGGCDHGKQSGCEYLKDIVPENKCDKCGCMKWKESNPGKEGLPVGRGCTRCSEDVKKQNPFQCGPGGGCTGNECKCAKEGKCCKCCCTDCSGCKKECSCDKEDKSYKSAYRNKDESWVEGKVRATWTELINDPPGIYHPRPITVKRHQCAQILLGSVCLIWCGVTYMHWTGKYEKTSPYWNNHILDGSGLDDGTLSQWLQALGFPQAMLNDSGPGNRWDAVITNHVRYRMFLGFGNTSGVHNPANYNYAGWLHQVDKGAFDKAKNVLNGADPNQHKLGPLYKLYILSCAYFTGLQQKAPPKAGNITPRTIREILYWLSGLPYSQAYKEMLDYAKRRLTEVTKKPGDNGSTSTSVNEQKRLSFKQTDRWHPINVEKVDLYAHFQAVTQYCPLVLIGIQGGLKSTDSTKEPPIHSLYANTECNFTYPTVPIQAYNQVVHYIRALFYQLYFLRKQCAVKVTCGGKWRECRYGSGVVSKGVISWMCLGCDPMEHDRNYRVTELKKKLDGVKTVSSGNSKDLPGALKTLLEAIGEVVVQLGNAQEVLENNINNDSVAVAALKKVSGGKNGNLQTVLEAVLEVVEKKVKELEGVVEKKVEALGALGGTLEAKKQSLEKAKKKIGEAKTALTAAKTKVKNGDSKDKLNAAHHGLRQVLEALLIMKEWWNSRTAIGCRKHLQDDIANAIDNIEDIVGSTRCVHCKDHFNKCGKTPTPTVCRTCHQPTTTGVPSPLQAFLEDRLPGFSCSVTKESLDKWEESNGDRTPSSGEYPPASAHLHHSNSPGQCCPLPMGFRNQFQEGVTHIGQRLYGILYFFSNENMMQSCVYRLVRVTSALSATTPQVLGDVFGFFRGGVGNKEQGKTKSGQQTCNHEKDPKDSNNSKDYFCGWCASGLRDEVKKIEWIYNGTGAGGHYMDKVGKALRDIKGDKDAVSASTQSNTTNLSTLTEQPQYVSPLTGELYTAVSATFGNTYLSWVLYLSDALEGGLQSLASAFQEIECRGCKGQCDPNKCKKGSHGEKSTGQCGCQSIVSCTGVLPVLYRHGFSYGNPFNLEGYHQKDKDKGDYSITDKDNKTVKRCHEFLESLSKVLEDKQNTSQDKHPLSNLLSQVGQLQYDIRLPWIFVLTVAWLVAVLYLAFGAIWPLDWTHMRSHWLRGGGHQWQCMWYKVMTGRKGVELIEYFGRNERE